MIHGKRMIFMVLPLLFVPLVYGISSTPDVCALPPDSNWGGAGCTEDEEKGTITCCWDEAVPPGTGNPIYFYEDFEEYCQECKRTAQGLDCSQKELQFRPAPGANLPQLEQVPTTPPPLFGQNLPQDLATLEETPPLFGQNIPQDLPTLEETPPSPLPPPPADPSSSRGGEVLEQPEVEEQDEPSAEEPEQPSVDEGSENN